MPEFLFQSDIKSLRLRNRGKVRDIYDIDDKHLLIVTTDRLSAFDVVLPDPIPGKGEILTKMSNFWFARVRTTIPNQLTDLSLDKIIKDPAERKQVEGRSIIVKKLKPLPIEAVVRGYLVGSGWKEYQASGTVCGIKLPSGLKEADRLPEPLFTPSTKAEAGHHDENISFDQAAELLGKDMAEKVKNASMTIYKECAAYALTRGIIIADTKFEFGLDDNGTLTLIDEVLTPDSSRFWPAESYKPGANPPSYDKQYVRDYLETLGWNKKPPAPKLPPEVINKTAEKYREALTKLTG
ncbi:MAG: phosphoribosylaminoimidazolesuccinocarboxamide synthase [Gammaproteobacteria bacterium]|nr:phosphoribosylaminoimidazolesuccinocarboxamide synthase [Gammaproteobacteria bacterium]MDH3369840.1 phosphoribosylaminoimidazolesuccinocarboxamide synthase [Gammaproteobacteria bacterium]MDH3405531.1 phosphoribosylaminoimidazolesuccinocarboxamide synthase [Gammaproteobacteria bacterium]MDH3562470.1 phosphoribosylaminoimidazolesuccinocarboxamide synthase [Gammaproteobacteria bacterium]